jgi:hypothetical protein
LYKAAEEAAAKKAQDDAAAAKKKVRESGTITNALIDDKPYQPHVMTKLSTPLHVTPRSTG